MARAIWPSAWRLGTALPGKVDAPDGATTNSQPSPHALAATLIKEFEGCHLQAYPDPLSGGKPYTVGWGSTRDEQGRPWKLGDTITQARANALLDLEVSHIYQHLANRIPFWQGMHPKMRAALISFAYNLGTSFYRAEGFKTISLVLSEKRWAEVPEVLLFYRNPGSNVEAGLLRRRKAEGRLWEEGRPNVI